MLTAFAPTSPSLDYVSYKPVAALCLHRATADGGPLPDFGRVGTGGTLSVEYFRNRFGYRPYEVAVSDAVEAADAKPFVDLMEVIRDGFGRTMARLPEVFGVSRQTLYNWLKGDTPKEQHRAKLAELAAAAEVFKELGFKPTGPALERTVAGGMSLLQLIGSGASGETAARKLVRIEQRGMEARAKLDAVLGTRLPPRLEASDFGAPSFAEDA